MCSLQLASFPLSSFSNVNLSRSSQSCKTKSSLLRLRLAGKQKCGVSSGINIEKNVVELPEGLDPDLMPKHVAVTMDGNRRWAKSKGLSAQQGHKAGGEAFIQLCRNCLKYGVKAVTVFAFSTENWVRQQDEVGFLMEIFQEVFALDNMKLTQEDGDGVRFSFVGNREQLPEGLQQVIRATEEGSKDNKRVQAVVALNYSGRYDITQATKRIARKVRDGVLEVEDIDDGVFEKHLETNVMEFPNPDLMIRTSGELRVSNFMLWQLAYTEMFFTEKMFPDFDHTDLIQAFTAFQKRQRRFGGHKG